MIYCYVKTELPFMFTSMIIYSICVIATGECKSCGDMVLEGCPEIPKSPLSASEGIQSAEECNNICRWHSGLCKFFIYKRNEQLCLLYGENYGDDLFNFEVCTTVGAHNGDELQICKGLAGTCKV